MFEGMAKPMPSEPPLREKIAVLMPDELAIHIDQRPARIAGIDGGVGLDEELIVRDADLRPGKRRDDAARHRLPDAEGIADGKDEIADFETVRVGELDDGELSALGIEAQHGKVDVLVLEHDLGRKLAPVRQGHGDLLFTASLDHVVVGNDEAAGIDQNARAE